MTRETRVRQCADALHAVKDGSVHGASTRAFYGLLLGELRASGKISPLSVRISIHEVRQQFGTAIYLASILDWPARKVATKLKLIPEHGYWSDNPLIRGLHSIYDLFAV